MGELLSIRMEGEKAIVQGRMFDLTRAKHLLAKAVEDIADEVEAAAKVKAPMGPTGELKIHPVDRADTVVTHIPDFFSPGVGTRTGIPLFGGGTAVRGPGGRFISPSEFQAPVFIQGELTARSVITVAREPKHAIWVHDGTGIYGPRRKMITAKKPGGFMTFPAARWPTAVFKRKNYRFRSVKGQPPNPYLTEAYLLIERTFMPVRIEQLRAEIGLET